MILDARLLPGTVPPVHVIDMWSVTDRCPEMNFGAQCFRPLGHEENGETDLLRECSFSNYPAALALNGYKGRRRMYGE